MLPNPSWFGPTSTIQEAKLQVVAQGLQLSLHVGRVCRLFALFRLAKKVSKVAKTWQNGAIFGFLNCSMVQPFF